MNSSVPLRLSLSEARLFHRRAVRLGRPLPDAAAALAHHGFIQIDPINVCGRMHDLILRNRVADYREGGLMRLLHGPADGPPAPAEQRVAFEHHLPHSQVLAALPLDAWPYLLAAMRNRTLGTGSWSGGLEPRQAVMAEIILREIRERGALSSEDLADGQRDDHGWGSGATLAKTTLHKLFFHGRLLIARRQGNRRYYDLPERVLPAAVLALPEPGAEETARWITLLKLRQRRLMTLSPAERAKAADLVRPLAVEGIPGLFCLRADLPLLDTGGAADENDGGGGGDGITGASARNAAAAAAAAAGNGNGNAGSGNSAPLSAAENRPLLLAPLDPLIYDRRLTGRLWGFDYIWEVYTPPEKRTRGYYALPLLSGLEIAGHIDPKADRKTGKLAVVSRAVRRGHRAAPAVRDLAGFLGLK